MSVQEEIDSVRKDVEEIKTFAEKAKRPKVRDFLSIELRRQETKLVELLEKERNQDKKTTAKSEQNNAPRSFDFIIKNYSWDQSDKFVKIYLTGLNGASGVDPSNVDFQVTPAGGVYFRLNNLNGKNHVFEIKETAHKVKADAPTKFNLKSDMAVILLAKTEEGLKWTHLKKSDKDASEKTKFTPKMDDTPNADPTQSLMTMMKQMYEEGDDDMKRTIAKAWTESNSKRPGGDLGLGNLDL